MKHEHIMVDLETFGNGSNAVITAIGAVAFTPHQPEQIKFYRLVNPESCQRLGMIIDASTVCWWLTQSETARSEMAKSNVIGENVEHVLRQFMKFCHDFGETDKFGLWGNGATFDNVILSEAYKAARIVRPWGFRQDRCYRTAVALLDPAGARKPPNNDQAHNALADAQWQAAYLKTLLELPA